MSETLPEDETVNEITGATVPRQDMVAGPASGRPLLLLKNLQGRPTAPPEAARLMKAAAERAEAVQLYKGKYTEEQKRKMGAEGHAFRNDDGSYSYPIGNTGDLHDAILAVGRGGAPHDAIRRYIRRRAKDLGAEGAIPESWSGEGKITKAMDIGEVQEDLHELHTASEISDGDTNEEAAGTVEPTHPGDPNDPGSPAWEATDAATARGALLIANKLTMILCKLRKREGQEVIAEGEDSDHVLDLDEAEAGMKVITGILAAFANSEQAEADHAAHEVEEQAEALGIRKSQEAPMTEPTPAPAAPEPTPLVKAGLSADDMRSMMKKLLASMSDEQVAAAFAEMASHATIGGGDDGAAADQSAPVDEPPAPPAPTAPEPVAKATESDVPTPAPANRSAVPGPDTTPTAVDGSQPLHKAQEAERPVDLMKALTLFGDQLKADLREDLRAQVEATTAPMQEALKKMQQRVMPGEGPLFNGVNVPPPTPGTPVTRGQASDTRPTPADPMVQLQKQLDGVTDPDQRTALQNQLAVTMMRGLQEQVGPAPTYGPRFGQRPAAQ